MSYQRTRPVDALQRIMTSFKHFERKIDKLQYDVSYHNQTLVDLRSMISNLSYGTIITPDGKIEELKRPHKKSAAIQYEDRMPVEEPLKSKRKNAFQPLPNKIKAKSFQVQKYDLLTHPSNFDASFHMNKMPSSPKAKQAATKHIRPRKAEAPRKATSLRAQKGLDKKRSKIPK